MNKKYNTYTLCLDVADGLSSITTKMDTQLDEFTKIVTQDKNLINGFHAIGIS